MMPPSCLAALHRLVLYPVLHLAVQRAVPCHLTYAHVHQMTRVGDGSAIGRVSTAQACGDWVGLGGHMCEWCGMAQGGIEL